ncbi:MAG TPA: SMC-Scp complex subunit ScpB [Vicinamibacterales bacterium]|nr:SMC-Scp complex subunit ScpB [Vicinamibacterales bacterium]
MADPTRQDDDTVPATPDDGVEQPLAEPPGETTSPVNAVDQPPDGLAEITAALDAEEAAADLKRPAAELKAIVEAMIFASPEPLTPKALVKLLDNEPKEDVLAALEELKADYERPGGLQLVEVAGGFQIVTRGDLHEWVRRLFHERSSQKLSVQALETLAVIAYRQPITALEITEIRGVSASGVLNTLLERHLVKIVGRKQVVGRPFMYATTKEFLIRFGLKDISDLPKVEDMAESLGIESTLLVEQVTPEEQLPLSEPDADGAFASSDDDQPGTSGSADDTDDDPDEDPGPLVH